MPLRLDPAAGDGTSTVKTYCPSRLGHSSYCPLRHLVEKARSYGPEAPILVWPLAGSMACKSYLVSGVRIYSLKNGSITNYKYK